MMNVTILAVEYMPQIKYKYLFRLLSSDITLLYKPFLKNTAKLMIRKRTYTPISSSVDKEFGQKKRTFDISRKLISAKEAKA
ncbi:MAG: hypothetical protein RIG77_11030 [Cyclobacteriaceae bacterium]